jgi:tripartite-type tricarboxylate transporter receptor subunit TctC
MLERSVAWLLSAGLAALGVGVVSAQTYPSKPIRIVTASVGGGSDLVARLIAQGIAPALGQSVIVDNRGNGVIPGEFVSKAPADGHTLLLQSGTLWLAPLMHSTPYDAVRDFAPITLAVSAPNVVAVHPSLPARSVKELIALVKARPGELNYASGSTGSSNHLAGELFKSMAGVNIVRVSYASSATQMADLISGEVQLAFATGGTVAPHIKSGRVRGLAVTSSEPSALFPGLPTVAASGLVGYEAATLTCVWAPAKTPAPVLNRLNQEIVRFLTLPETKERLLNAGLEPIASSAEQLAAKRNSEISRMGKVIKDAGIRE